MQVEYFKTINSKMGKKYREKWKQTFVIYDALSFKVVAVITMLKLLQCRKQTSRIPTDRNFRFIVKSSL